MQVTPRARAGLPGAAPQFRGGADRGAGRVLAMRCLHRWLVLGCMRRTLAERSTAPRMLHRSLDWRAAWICFVGWQLAGGRCSAPLAVLRRAAVALESHGALVRKVQPACPQPAASRKPGLLDLRNLHLHKGKVTARSRPPTRYASLLLYVSVRAWAVQCGSSSSRSEIGSSAVACTPRSAGGLGRSLANRRLCQMAWLQWLHYVATESATSELAAWADHVCQLWAGLATSMRRAAAREGAAFLRRCLQAWHRGLGACAVAVAPRHRPADFGLVS